MSDHIQCWICPTCHDDHRMTGPCTPKVDKPFTPSPDDHSYIADQYRNIQSQLHRAQCEVTELQNTLRLERELREKAEKDLFCARTENAMEHAKAKMIADLQQVSIDLAHEKGLRERYEELLYQAAHGKGDWYVSFPYLAREALRVGEELPNQRGVDSKENASPGKEGT